MFNKLLSNLPFNPSLINQVSFYSKRLKQEAGVRRIGFILVALTLVLQFFAVLSPAQPSLAQAGNDLIPGGFTSRAQAAKVCTDNAYGFRTIVEHYGISCSAIANSQQVTIASNNLKDGQPLFSMGRIAQGTVNSRTGRATEEFTVPIGGSNFYMRRLDSWDARVPSTYTALSVGNIFGVQYFILFSCGNMVQWGKPAPPAPKPIPKPTPVPKPKPKPIPKPKPKPCPASKNVDDIESCIVLHKTANNLTQKVDDASKTIAKADDEIKYTLSTKNTATVAYKNYVVKEDMSDVLNYADIISLGGASKSDSGLLTWPAATIGPGKTLTKQITIRVKNPVPKTPEPCNPAVVHPCPHTGSFDLTMTNVYGDDVNIDIKPPVAKTVEITTTKTLTNTGPGTSLIIGFSLTVMVGYFYARTRLMAKELDFVRSEYNSGGI